MPAHQVELNMETFKPCPSFPGYSASNQGRIKSRVGNVITQKINTRGYIQVKLHWGKHIKKNQEIHIMILDAWVGPRPAGLQCCHGKKGKLVNTPANLRWGTTRENALDRIQAGNNGKKLGMTHGPWRPVRRSDGREWKNASVAGRELELVPANICRVCKGRRKTYAGFGWKYLPIPDPPPPPPPRKLPKHIYADGNRFRVRQTIGGQQYNIGTYDSIKEGLQALEKWRT